MPTTYIIDSKGSWELATPVKDIGVSEKEREAALAKGDNKKAETLAITIESQKMLLDATKSALAELTR